jgi:C4-dicarboxylate transporter, DcuC family
VALLYVLLLALFAWLMISRRLTATLALPLAALSIAVAALLPAAIHDGCCAALTTLLTEVVDAGVSRLSSAIFAVLFGAILAAQLRISGAAERMVRYAAEYAGEDRFRLGLILLCTITLLFTTLGGLGAVIMVASLTLPLLLSLGFEPRVAGALFLLGLSLGGCFNPANWELYRSVLQLDTAQIIPFACVLAGIFFFVCCAFLLKYTTSSKTWLRQLLPLIGLLVLAGGLAAQILYLPAAWNVVKTVITLALAAMLSLLLGALLLRLMLRAIHRASLPASSWLSDSGNWLTGSAVAVPLLLLLFTTVKASLEGAQESVQIPIVAALLAGVMFCALASWTADGSTANRMMRALSEGVSSAGPAVVLLIGIGMLLKASSLPQVGPSLQPWLAQLPMHTPLGFIAVFFVLSPLALYRGPLNLYGMGSGVIELLHTPAQLGIMSGNALLDGSLIMVAFFSVGMLQGVCDPTNTHNVWIANSCRVPVAELTKLTVPWVLAVVLAGLAAGTIMFGGAF